MPQVSVGTAVVAVPFGGGETPLIQNLGPADIFLGRTPDLTVGNGILVAVGDTYEFPRDLGGSGETTIYLVSAAAGNDVRYLVVS